MKISELSEVKQPIIILSPDESAFPFINRKKTAYHRNTDIYSKSVQSKIIKALEGEMLPISQLCLRTDRPRRLVLRALYKLMEYHIVSSIQSTYKYGDSNMTYYLLTKELEERIGKPKDGE